MTWTRLSDDFTDRPEFLDVSRSARLLHIEAMVYCNRLLRNGRLPASAIPRITDAEDIGTAINELVKAGLWTASDDSGWQLDWSDQELAEDVRLRQQHQAEKQKRYRHRKARHERGDHSVCQAPYCKSVTRNATPNETGVVTPSRPVPSRPLGRDREQGAEPRSAGATRGRLIVGWESEAPLTDPTPADVRLYLNDYDDPHHCEVIISPAREAETDQAARQAFDTLAPVLMEYLTPALTGVRERHQCSGDPVCGASYYPDYGSIDVTMPPHLGTSWLELIRRHLVDHHHFVEETAA